MQNLPGGHIRFIGVPLSFIIMPAYQVWDFQISGGPGWIRTEAWDIVAEAEGVQGFLTIDQQRPMLRALMEDRFQLKLHKETKLMLGYALVVDKNGPKLRRSTDEKPLIQSAKGSLIAKKTGMMWLVGSLSQKLGCVVTDNTGLTGEFDFSLKWTPDPGENSGVALTPTSLLDGDGPSIFTALTEQLGLRLASQRVPTDVIVIDSVQQPSPN
jgi:bla regulator protein blaR1